MLCLALLRLTENLYAFVASILRQALDLCAVAAHGLIRGVDGVDENLGGLQGLFLRFAIRRLKNLEAARFSSGFRNLNEKANLELEAVPQFTGILSRDCGTIDRKADIQRLKRVFLTVLVLIGVHPFLAKIFTFVTGDPAVSFSRNKGIANGPNAGVACRQDLKQTVSKGDIADMSSCIPQCTFQVIG